MTLRGRSRRAAVPQEEVYNVQVQSAHQPPFGDGPPSCPGAAAAAPRGAGGPAAARAVPVRLLLPLVLRAEVLGRIERSGGSGTNETGRLT